MQRLTRILTGSQKPSKKIREIFFNLIQNNQGSITEIDLAMAANISGTDAKKYLEQLAVEFDATFEVTEKGQIVYLFPISNQTIQKNSLNATSNSLSGQQQKIASSPDSNKSVNSTSKKRQNHKVKLDRQVANITNNVKNVENEIQENLKNVENELKNVGDSLNNLFK